MEYLININKTIILSLLIAVIVISGCVNKELKRIQDDPLQQESCFLSDTLFSLQIKPEEGAANLKALLQNYKTKDDFEKRRLSLRKEMLYQIGLTPMPDWHNLNPVVNGKQVKDGYTIENVALEILPGVWTYGNIYRPTIGKTTYPTVMLAHGHYSQTIGLNCGRFSTTQQTIAVSLAKMGAIVFNFDMFAYGESGEQVGLKSHRIGLAETMNTLGCKSVLDYLETLPEVDRNRIAITGVSGGGTQSFYTTALDDRIAVSIPVAQVSCFFPGGCNCESGRPTHAACDPRTNNAEIAAMAVPRPLLVISDGGDWTRTVDKVEYPFIKAIYGLYGKEDNVENVHLVDEGHDYGYNKRIAMYDFLVKHFGLNKAAICDETGKYNDDYGEDVISDPESLTVFHHKYPDHSLTNPADIFRTLRSLQK